MLYALRLLRHLTLNALRFTVERVRADEILEVGEKNGYCDLKTIQII